MSDRRYRGTVSRSCERVAAHDNGVEIDDVLGRLADALHALREAEDEFRRFRDSVDTAGELALAARIGEARTRADAAAERLAEALARLPGDGRAPAPSDRDRPPGGGDD